MEWVFGWTLVHMLVYEYTKPRGTGRGLYQRMLPP